MSQKIYRQEVLDRLSSPEQLDQLMPVTGRRAWMALAGIGLLLAMGLAWGTFGTVTTTVEGRGLLLRVGGSEWVAAPQAGVVADFRRFDGDRVSVGDVLLRLTVPRKTEDGAASTSETIDIVSPREGRVLDVGVSEGQPIEAGAALVAVESPEVPLRAVVYVSASDGYRIERGMDAKLLPATESKQGATFLRGRVRTAARFPATHADMLARLQSEEWAAALLSTGPVLEVVVDVDAGAAAERQFGGTPCTAAVIVERRRPIRFLVPALGTGRLPR